MTTVIQSPAPQTDTGGNGFLIGILVLVGFVLVLIYVGIPAIKNLGSGQLSVPAPQIVVPNKIDINVKQAP
jgi:hypothetical protein